jgi:hypothetical protein
MKYGISLVAVAAVMLAMAAPAMASVDIDSTWTVDAAFGTAYTTDARFGSGGGAEGTVNIVSGGTWNTDGQMRFAENGSAATINVAVGGHLDAVVEMKWNEGDVGTQTNRLNVYGTAYVEQLKMYGTANDDKTVVGDGTNAAFLGISEGLLGRDGDATITIEAGSNMFIENDEFKIDGDDLGTDSYIDLVGTGTLQILIDAITSQYEDSIKGNGVLDDWVRTTGTFDGQDVYVYTASAPEPATMSLLAIGGLALLRRRRRRA